MEDTPELIVVCIDNSRDAYHSHYFRPQRHAIEHYCKAKLAANLETEVVLFTMAEGGFGHVNPPTSDIQKIQDLLLRIFDDPSDSLAFSTAIDHARIGFLRCPPNKQKRMLFLAGGFVDLFDKDAVEYGLKLKRLGIAVDVVNFYLDKSPIGTPQGDLLEALIEGELRSTRMELDAFVGAANSFDNSNIVHVEPGSSIRRVLSKSILRKTLRIKTDHHKRATHAAGDHKRVSSEPLYPENQGAKLGKKRQKRDAFNAC